jgi:hypothetical protein
MVIATPLITALSVLVAMNKRTVRNPFVVTLAVVFVVIFAAFRYFESTQVIDSFGVWNTMLTALVLSVIPAIIIYMAWRYLKK